jgi:TolB-like protein
MRTQIIQGLSVLLLILAVLWFIFDPGFEPVITAIAGLVGLFSGEFLKTSDAQDRGHEGRRQRGPHVPALGPSGRPSVVVLPFDNISPDPGDAYFSDGLTEQLIADLSRVRAIRVISRSSAMVLKNTQKDIRTIGRDLSVQYVVEGSVRKAGDSLRITAQLIDCEDDEHLWAESYDGTLEDVFGVQETVSRSIVLALSVRLSPLEEQDISGRPMPSVVAYDHYLRARPGLYSMSEAGLRDALEHLQKAFDLVGDNVVLYKGLGMAHFQFVNAAIDTDESHLREVDRFADLVEELDPDGPHAHGLRGLAAIPRGDIYTWVRELRQALAIDPTDPDTMFWLVAGLCSVNLEEAREIMDRLLPIDPLNPFTHWLDSMVHLFGGHGSSDYLPAMRRARELDRDNLYLAWNEAHLLVAAGQTENAVQAIEEIVSSEAEDLGVRLSLVLRNALEGNVAGVQAAADELRASIQHDPQYNWFMADCFSILGEEDSAIDWLEQSIDRGLKNYPFFAEFNPLLANLRAHPRFKAAMERVRREWETFQG